MTSIGADGKTAKPRSKRCLGSPNPSPEAERNNLPSDASLPTSDDNNLQNDLPENSPDNLGDSSQPDCPLLLRNECPHGQSGKRDGQCQYKHRPRCSKYMKWGDKSENGCKKSPL